MTSTEFTLGLQGERNSSRVLKPPGGGHTDIFASAEPAPVRKDNGRNASSILEGTNTNPPKASPVKTAPPPENKKLDAPAAAPERARVPPGGFSSGFW